MLPERYEHPHRTDSNQEWSSLIEHVAVECADSTIVGEVNIHIDSDTNADAHRFKDSLSTCGLKKHVNDSTHIKYHTLDAVIANEDSDNVIQNVAMTDPVLRDTSGNISGYQHAISFSARLSKPRTNRAIVQFQKLHEIDTKTFKECICQDKNLCDIETPLHDQITNYIRSLNDIINSNVPLLNRAITLRPLAPW